MSPCVIGLGSIRFHFLCSMKLFFLYKNLTNFVISCTSLQVILFLMVTFKDSFLNSTMPENSVGLFCFEELYLWKYSSDFHTICFKMHRTQSAIRWWILKKQLYFREEPGFGMLRHISQNWNSVL